MKTYIINYDLRQQRNYQVFYDAIQTHTRWAHVLVSTWAIESNKTAAQIRDELSQHIGHDDGLIVASASGEVAWVGLKSSVSDWLKQSIDQKTTT